MGEYGAVGSQGSSLGGGGASQGNLFADVTNSVIHSLLDLADQIMAMPPYMLLLLAAVVIIGGLFVFRRV